MKKWIVTGILLCAASMQAQIQFSVSPTGTDVGTGFSPSNTVPQATTSTGSGGLLSPTSLSFQPTNNTLSFAFGYGSAAGFSNLTGAATQIALRGPAGTGSNAPVVVDLTPFNFSAANPALGGVVFGSVPLTPTLASNLLAGQLFVTIGTTAFPLGELRGQLSIASNAPPVVICPAATNIQCGASNTAMFAQVSSANRGALTVVTAVSNGGTTNSQTNSIAAGSSPQNPSMVAVPGGLPLGTNTVTFTALDTNSTNRFTCSTTITVTDTNPPTITDVSATPSSLWPPNNKMVSVTIRARAFDTCGIATWRIIDVTSNNTGSHGNRPASSDSQITGPHTVLLEATKAGGSNASYTITVQATDQSGNESAPATVTVSVGR